MTYQAREPVTPGARWQELCEETYARQDDDTIRAYFDLGSDPIPEAAEVHTENTKGKSMETQEVYRVTQQHADRRRQWLAERVTGVGGSDAAVVLGMSPWKSRYELWAEKSGMFPVEDGGENE